MKFSLFLIALGIAITQITPCNAIQQPPNIGFPRLAAPLGGVTGAVGIDTKARYLRIVRPSPILQDDPKSDDNLGFDFNYLALPGMVLESNTDGSKATGFFAPFVGRILSPVGSSLFVPDHEISNFHDGFCQTTIAGATSSAAISTQGQLLAVYGTEPGSAVVQGPSNMFATMSIYMYFLAVGNTDFLEPSIPAMNGQMTELQFLAGSREFRQRIIVGQSDLELTYLGMGVFNTSGVVAASTETTSGTPTTNYFSVDYGSVNHLITANQKIALNSPSSEVLRVEMVQNSATIGGSGPSIGTASWVWTFNTKAWFEGEDLSETD